MSIDRSGTYANRRVPAHRSFRSKRRACASINNQTITTQRPGNSYAKGALKPVRTIERVNINSQAVPHALTSAIRPALGVKNAIMAETFSGFSE
ncbi:hypothetical protein [Paraburkholderia jirisanensis]